jgi:hypothetical protein
VQSARGSVSEARSPLVFEGDAREARQLLDRARKDPIAIHAKVRVKDRAVGEVDQLVLAATLHGGDPLPFGALRRRPRKLTPLRRVMGFETLQRLPFDCGAETCRGFVDFGEFGHSSNVA